MRSLSKSQQASLQKLQGYPKMYVEVQVAQNSQNNFERQEQNWKSHTSWFQNSLQSDSSPGSVILA